MNEARQALKERVEADKFELIGSWIVEKVDACTCGSGADITKLYGHEPGCGIEPVAPLETLITAEERVRELATQIGDVEGVRGLRQRLEDLESAVSYWEEENRILMENLDAAQATIEVALDECEQLPEGSGNQKIMAVLLGAKVQSRRERDAEKWDEGAEAITNYQWVTTGGQPIDSPPNPYVKVKR